MEDIMDNISAEIFVELKKNYPSLAPLFAHSIWEPIPCDKANTSLTIYAAQSCDETVLAWKKANGKIVIKTVCW